MSALLRLFGIKKKKRSSASLPDQLTLSSLPPDIIRLVVKADENSVDVVRLISPKWNAVALEFISSRKVLASFKWEIPIKGCTWLNVEHRKTGHFLRFNSNWVKKSSDLHDHEVHFRTFYYEKYILDVLSNMKIEKILSHCSRINYILLDIDIMKSKYAVELLNNSLAGQAVDWIQFKTIFNINKMYLKSIIKITKGLSFERVVLRFFNGSPLQSVKVLQRFVAKALRSTDIVEFRVIDFLDNHEDNFQTMCEDWEKIRSDSYPNAELAFVKTSSDHIVRLLFNKNNVSE